MKTVTTIFTVVAAAFLVGGCNHTAPNIVADAEGVEIVSVASMSCKKPFALTVDCSGWSGPTKKIEISGIKMKVASNANRKMVVMYAKVDTGKVGIAYELMKGVLVKENYKIVKVTPIGLWGSLAGYAIETDKPNYHIWDKFSV